jgi:hypothetical protein
MGAPGALVPSKYSAAFRFPIYYGVEPASSAIISDRSRFEPIFTIRSSNPFTIR